MQKFVFDSSFLVGLICKEDIHHNLAALILEMITDTSHVFMVNELIYAETLTVVNYKIGREWVKNLDIFLDQTITSFVKQTNMVYFDYFRASGQKMSVFDLSVVYDEVLYCARPLTFDNQLEKYRASVR